MNTSSRAALPNKPVRPVVSPVTQDERAAFNLQLADKDKTIERVK